MYVKTKREIGMARLFVGGKGHEKVNEDQKVCKHKQGLLITSTLQKSIF